MRNLSIWMGALAVVGLTAAGCSSNFEKKATGTTGTSGADPNGGRTLSLRGCIEDGVPAGTYVLRASGAGQNAVGAPAGTSGSREAGQPDVDGTRSGRLNQDAGLYRLIATGNLDFGQNVGKEVTVTGEIAREANDNTVGTTGPAGGQDRNNGGGRVQGDAADQTAGATFLRVTSMNKVSDSCSVR